MKAAELNYIESKLETIQNMYPTAKIEIVKFKDGYGIGFVFNEFNDYTILEEIEGIPVIFVHYDA